MRFPFQPFSLLVAALLLGLGLVSPLLEAAGIMGIDFGTDWYKVALVKPGVPLEIVLNKDSTRKTDAHVTIRAGIRYFGSDAVNLALKAPQDSYGKLKNLLGRSYDDATAKDYRSTYDNSMLRDSVRGTIQFQHDANTTFSVEELVAMQLAKAKKDVAVFAEEVISDAVITVPPFWTHHERRAILDAAEMAGIRVLSLINDETAVALNYAMTRTFDDPPQYHIFYDMGAGSTVATLVEFKNVVIDKPNSRWSKPSNATSIEVLSVGYDRSLGGHEFDVRLQKLLAQRFQETQGAKAKAKVFDSQRAMAKLLKEANRVKHVLSANADAASSVEGLHEEIDFRTRVTREELESICADLFDRVKSPIDSVLTAAGKTLADVQSIVLVGGNIRIPSIQKRLIETVGVDKIAKHVNQDEAAVMGATFYGAIQSPLFRVPKKYAIQDVTVAGISFSHETESKKDGKARVVEQKLFKPLSPSGVKKQLSFKKLEDFSVHFKYDEETVNADPALGVAVIADVHVKGIKEALVNANLTEEAMKDVKVKLLVGLTTSGLLSADNATLDVTVDDNKTFGDSLKDKVMSFFGGSGSEEDATVAPKEEINTSEGDEVKKPEMAVDNEPKTKVITLPLQWKLLQSGILPCSEDFKQDVIKRQVDEQDRIRKAREEARNSLEAFVYKTMDMLTRDDIIEVSNAEQRDTLQARLSETSEWLYDDGDLPATPTSEFQTRLAALKKLYDPIALRKKEVEDRPFAVKQLQKSVEEARSFLNSSHYGLREDARLLKEEDAIRLSLMLQQTEQWLKDMTAKQAKLKKHDVPVLLSSEVNGKKSSVDAEMMILQTRKRLAAKASSSSASSSASASSASASSASAASASSASGASAATITAPSSSAPTVNPTQEPQPIVTPVPTSSTMAVPNHDEL